MDFKLFIIYKINIFINKLFILELNVNKLIFKRNVLIEILKLLYIINYSHYLLAFHAKIHDACDPFVLMNYL